MKRVLFFILFIVSYLSFFSQKGNLEISYRSINYGNTLIELYKNDSDTLIDFCNKIDFECCFNGLAVGLYNAKIFDNDTLVKRIYSLEVKEESVSSYSFYYESPYVHEINDTIADGFLVTTVNYLSSLNNPEFTSLINREFRIAVLQGESFIVNKNIEVGIKGGGEISLTDFKNDTSLVGLTGVKRERYFDWNLAIEPTIRFSSNNRTRYETKGLFLELGACYHFPLVFRYAYNLNGYKYTQSRIHNFNNLEGVVRLGYQEFSLMASYRFFDVVKGSLPQLPKLNVGLSLMITQ